MKVTRLRNVRFGTPCRHTGKTIKSNKKINSPFNDKDIKFIKTSDASQLTKEGKEVIFHPNDLVEIV